MDMSSDLTVGVGTPLYCSPEEMLMKHYTEKVCVCVVEGVFV